MVTISLNTFSFSYNRPMKREIINGYIEYLLNCDDLLNYHFGSLYRWNKCIKYHLRMDFLNFPYLTFVTSSSSSWNLGTNVENCV